jgi:hypothetical protein
MPARTLSVQRPFWILPSIVFRIIRVFASHWPRLANSSDEALKRRRLCAKSFGAAPINTPALLELARVHELRGIWRNEGTNGSWYTVTFERLYKDGDDRKSSSSFGRDDLLPLAKLADLVHSWVVEQEAHTETR